MPFLHVSFLKCLRIYSIGVFVVYGSRSASYNAYERKYMNMSNLILLCRHPRSNLPATQPLWTLTSTCAYIRYRRTYFYYTSSEYIVRDDNDASTTGMMVYYSDSLRVCVYMIILFGDENIFALIKYIAKMVLHILCDARCSGTIHLYLV